jgi:hypothetical protein
MQPKSKHELTEQFLKTYESRKRQYLKEGFEVLDATELAARSMVISWAEQYVESDRFHTAQLAIRDVNMKKLQEQNKRQAEMLEKFMC